MLCRVSGLSSALDCSVPYLFLATAVAIATIVVVVVVGTGQAVKRSVVRQFIDTRDNFEWFRFFFFYFTFAICELIIAKDALT